MRTQAYPKGPPPMSEAQARRHIRQQMRTLILNSEPPAHLATDSTIRRLWRVMAERIAEDI